MRTSTMRALLEDMNTSLEDRNVRATVRLMGTRDETMVKAIARVRAAIVEASLALLHLEQVETGPQPPLADHGFHCVDGLKFEDIKKLPTGEIDRLIRELEEEQHKTRKCLPWAYTNLLAEQRSRQLADARQT